MIIISQDKTRTTQRLELYIQQNTDTDELQHEIRTIGGGSFGGYKTEERAKEVLQEIVDKYKKYTAIYENDTINILEYPKVYEMPEK